MAPYGTLTAAAAVVALLAGAGAAQASCSERTDVLAQLSKQFSEQPVAMGLANNGGVIEILSEPSGTSWSIIITMPSGISCMIATGSAFEVLPGSTQVKGEPVAARSIVH